MTALWLLLFAFVIAIYFRVPDLAVRPMHVDETTQALKLGQLLDGKYEYDPVEHHGPTQLYVAAVVKWFQGVADFNDLTEDQLRMTPVLIGLLLVLLTTLVWDGMGKSGGALAALMVAVSPLMVFYSRYFIMEILLVLLSFTTIACGWRFLRSRNLVWLILCGASIGGMHATKETFVIHCAAMVGGLLAVTLFKFTGAAKVDRSRREPLGKRHLVMLIGVAAFVSVLCFTQGFTRLNAAWDSIATYGNYINKRATGQGHEKPITYYFLLLVGNKGGQFWAGPGLGKFVWSEAFVLVLAAIGMARAFFGRGRSYDKRFVVFLSVYAVLNFAAYSLISYKTPWCIMSAHHAFLLLAGFGAAGLFSYVYGWFARSLLGLALGAGIGHLALQSWRANFLDNPNGMAWLRTGNHFARAECPYAYGFTPVPLRDGIVSKIDRYSAQHPEGKRGLHVVIASPGSGWPLPWFLRHYPRLEIRREALPETDADVILVDPDFVAALPERIRGPEHRGSDTYVADIKGALNQQFWVIGFVRKSLLPAADGQAPEPPAPTPATNHEAAVDNSTPKVSPAEPKAEPPGTEPEKVEGSPSATPEVPQEGVPQPGTTKPDPGDPPPISPDLPPVLPNL